MTHDIDRPRLSLGEPPGRLAPATGAASRPWLAAVLILQLAILGVLGLLLWRLNSPAVAGPAGSPRQAARPSKSLALELEKRSLAGPAAEAWEQYLAAAPHAPDRAEVLYRIGKLYLQAERYEQSAAALIGSDLAAGDDASLRDKVGPLLVTCLRRLGRYGEVGRELSRRVEAGGGDLGQGQVLATLAGEPLTEADLDRAIERRVDQMLTMQNAAGDDRLRQQLLQQLSGPELRRQLFHELLQTELFTRRARELQLDQEDDFLAVRQAMEDSLLADRFLARELEKIQPTEVDIQSYYQAHQAQYRQPESLEALIEPLAADEDHTAVLAQIQSADDFQRLVQNRHAQRRPAEPAPQSEVLVRGRPHPVVGDPEPLFQLDAGQWTVEPIANQDRRCVVLVQSKTPAHTPPVEEIRWQVQADYLARKQDELSRRLFRDLLERYDVQLRPLDAGSAVSSPPAAESSQSTTP